MLILIILIIINLAIIDYSAVRVYKEFQKMNNLSGSLNFDDLDDDFWKE